MTLIVQTIKGVALTLETVEGLFSPEGVDLGTLAMLSTVELELEDRVLDLGCGYGVVGILAARLIGPERVWMADVNPEAVEMARKNADRNGVTGVHVLRSDGFQALSETGFTLILSNPPYHEDFSVPKRFIEEGFQRLALGGRLVMVVKRLTWYKNKLGTVFGGVKVEEIDGYYILTAEKRSTGVSQKKEPAVSKKHAKRLEEAAKLKKRMRR